MIVQFHFHAFSVDDEVHPNYFSKSPIAGPETIFDANQHASPATDFVSPTISTDNAFTNTLPNDYTLQLPISSPHLLPFLETKVLDLEIDMLG